MTYAQSKERLLVRVIKQACKYEVHLDTIGYQRLEALMSLSAVHEALTSRDCDLIAVLRSIQ